MSSRSSRRARAALFIGFIGIAISIVLAYLSPASGHELSIYRGTPVLFWLCSVFALLVSVVLVFSRAGPQLRAIATFLGGLTLTTIVSLPLIRGYHYLGESDSLSHLGTAMEMSSGSRALTDSRYPIVHTFASMLHDTTGFALRHAILVLVVTFVVCFLVFVPLVVRQLSGGAWTTYIGFFSGLLLLPINHLSPSLYLHPTSQAIMYAPALLFVFFAMYKSRMPRYSALFLLLGTVYVLLHPQQAANFVLFFGVIATMQIGNEVFRSGGSTRWRSLVIPEVTAYAAVFALWAKDLPVFWRNFERVYMIPFQDTQAARSTATRGVSLAEVGGSLPEVFLKLFFVSLVYVLLTALLMLLVLKHTRRPALFPTKDAAAPDGGTEDRLPLYVVGGLFAVTTIFFVYLVGGISDQYFRHLGMLMVFGTILGAVMLGRLMQYFTERWSASAARWSIALILVLCSLLALPVVFNSPYIYYSSDHVTEAQMSGYATTFEHQSDGIVFDEVRSKVYRYGHALQGSQQSENSYYRDGPRGIPDHFNNQSLHQYYDEPIYVPVTEADRDRDAVLWNGFRFSHDDFAYLDSEPGINRVQTNGGYDLYLVTPENGSINQSL